LFNFIIPYQGNTDPPMQALFQTKTEKIYAGIPGGLQGSRRNIKEH
jgi:hypothetical protein